MHGLVSLLPKPYCEKVESIWRKLENEFGLQGIQVTPYPHFSWLIGEDFPNDQLLTTMQEIAHNAASLTVNTTGLAIFPGEKPVLFIPVVKTEKMFKLHEHIWDRFQEFGKGISPLNSPDNWVPHISIGYQDITQHNIGEILKTFAFQEFNWEMKINNLSFIYETEGSIGKLQHQMKFR